LAQIKKILNRLAKEHKAQGELFVVFNNDKQMSSLNYQFKKKNRPTDVLAFNLAENTANNYIEGEIYVNLQIAKRQAAEYEATYLEEVIRLCLHGFLHLLGYDDLNTNAKKEMWIIQENYLTSFKEH